MVRFLICLLFAFLLVSAPAYADKASKLNKRGIEAYRKQNAEESAQHFTDALVERPDSPELRFNRGTALSAAGKTEEAVSELERAASEFKTDKLSAASHYNAGNTFFASGDLEKAIEHYKQAVKLDQSSSDIRHNLELALQQKQQQEQQQQENNDQKQDDKKEDQDKEKQDKDDSQDEQEKDQEQNQDEQQQQQESEDQKEQQQPSGEQKQQPMTQEEAQRLLDAMNDEEQKALEARKQIMQEAAKQGDDW